MIRRRMWSHQLLLAAGIAAVLGVAGGATLARSPSGYPWHPGTVASVFGPDEDAHPDNAFITNAKSAWDKDWRRHAPHENQFFVAVPYADYLDDGGFNPDNVRIPWHRANITGRSEIKNRWVQITRRAGKRTLTAYGQVEDVGPSDQRTATGVSDPDYVFGPPGHDPDPIRSSSSQETRSGCAPASISRTALARALKINGAGTVNWRFVEAEDVPQGLGPRTSPPVRRTGNARRNQAPGSPSKCTSAASVTEKGSRPTKLPDPDVDAPQRNSDDLGGPKKAGSSAGS